MSVGARSEVERLSQNAMLPAFHLKHTVYSGRVTCSHSSFEQLLALAWVEPDERFDVRRADEQHALAGFRVHAHQQGSFASWKLSPTVAYRSACQAMPRPRLCVVSHAERV